MRRRSTRELWPVVSVLSAVVLQGTLVRAADRTARGDGDEVARSLVQRMATAAGTGIDASYSPLNGRVTFLSVRRGLGIPPGTGALSSPEDRTRSFLKAYGPAFGLGPESEGRVTRVVPTDTVGLEHVRVQQTYRGIPVVAAELMLHFRGRDVVAANGKALPEVAVDTIASVDQERAREVVRELARKHLRAPDVQLTKPELQILNRGLLEGVPRPTHLAWFVVATDDRRREYVWVDAHRGGVLLHFNQRPEALNRTVYDAAHGGTLPGTLVRSEGQGDTGDADVDNAYRYAGDTYDYYLTQHGRDSYDGAGGEIRSSVRYCDPSDTCPMQNAFWNGTQMAYGDGFSAADDVVAHELTHAVTERTANLFYYMQSGALNESLSDIFGETIDLTNAGGTDTPAVRWQVGEDVPGVGAIRDMMSPNSFGNPGKVSDPQFYCGGPNGSADGGGVHINSGVPNHAYALTVDGGTYNGYTVSGIGLAKAGRIEYRALTAYLLSGSDFLDYEDAVEQSCADLVGTAGITEVDCLEMGKALDAVQMSQPWPCTPAQAAVPALCPAGETAVDVWSDDFESTTSGQWSTSLLSGTYNHWNVTVTGWRAGTGDSNLYFTGFASDGTHHLWAYNHEYPGNAAAQMATGVTLPAGARLQFDHSFGFENYDTNLYDGGVVEYCTGACATWTDAGSLIAAGAAYNGTVASGYGNPLAGRSAFTRESWGYTATQMDLGTLAGQSFRLRFRIGTDNGYDDYGWFVDDVRIYQCASLGPPTVTGFDPTSGPVGTPVAITGTNFAGATEVRFGDTAATAYSVDSATSISATVPPGATTGPISVTTPGGTAASSASFTVTPTCSYAIDPTSASHPAGGGSATVGVTASEGCAWTATSADGWITVTSGAAGSGDGTVGYTVAANDGFARTGSITIAGLTFAVSQAGPCSATLSPTSAGVGSGGGTGSFEVTAGPGCAWSAASSQGWLTVTSGASGTGSGSVGYSAAANASAPRTGTITVATETFTLQQAGTVFTDSGIGLTGLGRTASAWGDYDNDGDLDLLMTGCSNTGGGECFILNAKLYRNDGGALTSVANALAGVDRGSVAWGDYDRDGDLDVVASGCDWEGLSPFNGNRVCFRGVTKLYNNEGGGSFVDSGAAMPAKLYQSAQWGDYDNDGDLDLLLSAGFTTNYSGAARAEVLRNDGGGAFVAVWSPSPVPDGAGAAAWADYDNDGDLDFAIPQVTGTTYVTTLFRNDGGLFVEASNLPSGVLGSVTWADYDGDGDLDLLVTGIGAFVGSEASRLYRNDGGTLVEVDAGLPGVSGSGTWGDYDNDGDPDVLLVGSTGSTNVTKVYRNDAGVFSDSHEVLPANRAGAWGDFDNDGDLDLVLGGSWTGLTASLYRNGGTTPNGVPAPPTGLDAVAGLFSWTAASDAETPAASLTYNLRVGTTPGGSDVVSPMASAATGYRRVVRMGEAGQGTTAALTGLGPGSYYWSVQAVDSTFAGSPFAPESSLTVCAITLAPPSASVPATAGSASVDLTAAAGCTWGATSLAEWISVSGPRTGDGSGSVTYSYAANTGPSRTGLIAIAGQSFSVDQAEGCGYSIAPTAVSVGAGDGTGIVAVTTAPGCPWTAVSNDPWITVTSGASGTRGGSVGYAVAANAGGPRSGSLTIAGETFAIDQAQSSFVDVGTLPAGTADSVAWGDYDNDGDLDILLARFIDSRVLRNDGGGTFVDVGASLVGHPDSLVAWGDYDSDGDLDALVPSKVYRNDGGGTFVDILSPLTPVTSGSAAWGDYDNDGDLDILLSGYTAAYTMITKVYRNDGGGTFVDVGAALTGIYRGASAWGDYDGDGDLDVALSGCPQTGSCVSKVFRNDAGTFVDAGAGLAGLWDSSVAWGDYDNDGDLDLLVTGANLTGNSVSKVYRNDAGTFVDTAAPLAGGTTPSGSWGDYDNDGDLDILLASTSVLEVYTNEGGAGFAPVAALSVTVTADSAAWGDYDNDGDLDIVVTGDGSGPHVYRNDTPTPNSVPTAPSGLDAAVGAGDATLTWAAASDSQTSAPGLTYNLRVGTTPGGTEIVTPMASPPSGYRRVPQLGNAGHGTAAVLKSLPFGTYYWSVQAIDTAFAGSPFAGERSFVVGSCAYSLDPTSASPSAAGGPGSVTVTAGAGCNWTAVSNDAWISVTSGASGSGDGSVGYSVEANPGPPRTGTMTVAGLTFTVEQAAACSYSIDPTSASVAAAGGPGSVTVTAGAGCPWTATSNDAWITVTAGASGSGDGSVGYSVGANSGLARSGSLTIADQTFTVDQAAAGAGQGSGFFTLAPCRVLDTRNPVGPYGGPALAAGTNRTFTLSGRCGIPATAIAVSVNLTVTQPSAAGNLRVYPGGMPPPVVSAINYSPSQTRANNAIVVPNELGEIAVRCNQASGTVHFILDVNGYFEEDR